MTYIAHKFSCSSPSRVLAQASPMHVFYCLLLTFLMLFSMPFTARGQHACPAGTPDEGAVINSAISACPNGCTIQVPPNAYCVFTPIVVSNPGIKIVGGGQANTVLYQAFNGSSTTKGDLITVTSNYFDLSGLTLNGNFAATGYNLVHIIAANHAKIHENVFTDVRPLQQNTTNAIRIEGVSTTAIANFNQVIDNSFVNVPWIGVSVATFANSNNIQANQFANCYTAFDFNGNLGSTQGNSFSNNMVTGGDGTNFLESVTSSIITGNQFIASGTQLGYTIYMHLASGSAQSITTIANNSFLGGPGGGIYIYDNSREVIVSNNYFGENGTDGIFISNAAGAVVNLTINGNIFRNNGTQNPNAGFGAIRVETATNPVSNWLIANNSAYDDQATPSQAYGLFFFGSGSASNLTILGNDFSRNKTAAIQFNIPISASSIGPNRESTAGGWVNRGTTGAVD
jgi:hypothetical protein